MDHLSLKSEFHHFVIRSMDLLRANYVFPEVAEAICGHLENRMKDGYYFDAETYEEFKKLFEHDIQSINGDNHLHIWLQGEGNDESEEMMEEYKRVAEKNNFGFHKVERLAGNIGYIDLRVFYDMVTVPEASETAISAMNFVAHSDALIIDLRKNIGGSAFMVALIASYLLKEPTHIESFYNRSDDKTSQVWTQPYVPGKLFLEKPVFILTSMKTFSAGELFAYALKHLGRATIIGESTGGGAQPGNYHQVTPKLRLFIPSGRSISPFTGDNWEGQGVLPDYETTAEEALHIAHGKALDILKEKYEGQKEYQFLFED
ncbi:S41 family peptidase [Mesobacillus sp. S13]|uniref:S41 family peptidase n=1 Tax=Mesobacillus sp. S13 TaxID=2880221 RepID=UPI001CF238A9|nr:S41 family peptidase [Mesobacillus sp. S13]